MLGELEAVSGIRWGYELASLHRQVVEKVPRLARLIVWGTYQAELYPDAPGHTGPANVNSRWLASTRALLGQELGLPQVKCRLPQTLPLLCLIPSGQALQITPETPTTENANGSPRKQPTTVGELDVHLGFSSREEKCYQFGCSSYTSNVVLLGLSGVKACFTSPVFPDFQTVSYL